MIGTGPAAQMAAYQAAGVRIRRLAVAFELPREDVTALVLGIRLHEAYRTDPELQLQAQTNTCMIVGCGQPLSQQWRLRVPHPTWKLCAAHLTRLYLGHPLIPSGSVVPIRLGRCVACGATWCNLRANSRRLCGSRACLARTRRLRHQARDTEILDRVRSGEHYRDIAGDYGISDRRVAQLANRAGLFRYRQRRDSRRGR